MDIHLEPPRAAGPLGIGMTVDEAVAAVEPWGGSRVRTWSKRVLVTVLTSCDLVGVEALLEDGNAVTAVELWCPGEGKETSTRVLLDGADVFRTPADELLRSLEERGLAAHGADGEDPFVPGLSLGFTRHTSQEVKRTESGLPVYFTSVLVGGTDYYAHRL
ncbi:hypothetical protein ACFW96_35345 [Streptomyces gardneri]|uniref:hypothetical protein n=1 Tax=Streptomyces gardneri TaxID=66892 RepID=UPI0036848313